MIETTLLYQMYIEMINLRINDLLEESLSYHTIHSNLMDKLYSFMPYIDLCSNYTLDEMLELVSMNNYNKIYFSTDEVFINDKIYKKDVLMMYLKNYIEVNRIVVKNDEKINKLKSKIIDRKVYKKVLTLFNRGITSAMIEEGYIFKPGGAMGTLYISKVVSENPRVNIGESMKIKAKLIEEGKKPYVKSEEEEYLAKGLEYDGIKYFVYYPNIDFMVKWRRPEILRKWFPFVREFIYKPPNTRTNSFMSNLRGFVRENYNRALILFDRGENNYERSKVY